MLSRPILTLKSGKQLVKLGIRPYVLFLLLVLKVMKLLDNYYTTVNLLAAFFRIDYLQLNCVVKFGTLLRL